MRRIDFMTKVVANPNQTLPMTLLPRKSYNRFGKSSRCFNATFILISSLFLQHTIISSSLVLRQSMNYVAVSRSNAKIHHISFSSPNLSSLHLNKQDKYGSSEFNMPSHEFNEEDYAFPSSSSFNRQNYKRNTELSERNKNKLRALYTSDTEWDDYSNIDLDDSPEDSGAIVSSDSAEVDRSMLEESNMKRVGSSSLDKINGKDDQTFEAVSDKQPPIQNDKDEYLSLKEPEQGTNISVSDFRKQYKAKADVSSDETTPASTKTSTGTSRSKMQQTRISNEQIDQIKSTISIVDAIETYNLQNFVRTNTNSAKACCPFHDDHNPSMSIDENRGMYKCFACGAGGDLFNFIREYDALDGKKEKMGFMEAVQYALKEFGDSRLAEFGNYNIAARTWDDTISDEKKAKIIEREKNKDRIRHANNAAAAFYTKNLVILPTAGKARAYLRSRNLSPDSIRTFALGYAPDCYYGDEFNGESTTSRKIWGKGSLVEYLSNLGFTSNEIVEAGLAVRTKKKRQDKSSGNQEDNNNDDPSAIMDRFRNRLIVPILDKKGRNVIGFGGRYLESESDSDSSYTHAKYINSPESPVFRKKEVLFNEHNAQVVIENDPMELASNAVKNRTAYPTRPRQLPVIIVEGYFDAMSLSNVGVKNVVASMGTALTVEQLKSAADMVDSSQIILLMDNDDAGRSAVERSSNTIVKTRELAHKEILVATLPEGVKDPSDFVTDKGLEAKDLFEIEVLNQACPWDEWCIRQMVKKHADGKSFANICDEVSSFLATFSNPADRTRRIHDIVDVLLDVITKDSDSKSSLGMMRVQLESDLVNMVSRKASIRESMERRIEEKEGSTEYAATLNKLDVMTRGEAAGEDVKQHLTLSRDALAKLNPPAQRQPAPLVRQFQKQPPQKKRTYKTSQVKQQEKDLVPHFNGFQFKHKSDRDWLGLSGKSKPKMYLGSTGSDENDRKIRAEMSIFGEPPRRSKKENEVVYFNSNQYIGSRYLTPQAMNAGYLLGGDKPSAGESLIQFTDRMLLERDADEMILHAESRLLHALAKFSQARDIMRTVYSPSTFIPPNMKWTNGERQWLFQCLTGLSEPPLPKELLDGGTARQLRLHIANLDDCPPNAFISDTSQLSIDEDTPETDSRSEADHKQSTGQFDNTSTGRGSLETYFLDAAHLFPSFSNTKIAVETRAELTVQETVATLLRATAIQRFLSVKSKFAKVVFEIDHRAAVSDSNQQQQFFDEDFATTTSDELGELFDNLAIEVMEAQRSLYESDRSTDRVNAHLLDYSTTNSVQFRTSQAGIERLNKIMDDYIDSLPEDDHKPDVPGDDETYIFGLDETSEQIDAQFGGRNVDDFTQRGLPNGDRK